MANVKFTDALRSEYQTLFDTCQIKPTKAAEIDQVASVLIGY